jgi:hypothetical protein
VKDIKERFGVDWDALAHFETLPSLDADARQDRVLAARRNWLIECNDIDLPKSGLIEVQSTN